MNKINLKTVNISSNFFYADANMRCYFESNYGKNIKIKHENVYSFIKDYAIVYCLNKVIQYGIEIKLKNIDKEC